MSTVFLCAILSTFSLKNHTTGFNFGFSAVGWRSAHPAHVQTGSHHSPPGLQTGSRVIAQQTAGQAY